MTSFEDFLGARRVQLVESPTDRAFVLNNEKGLIGTVTHMNINKEQLFIDFEDTWVFWFSEEYYRGNGIIVSSLDENIRYKFKIME